MTTMLYDGLYGPPEDRRTPADFEEQRGAARRNGASHAATAREQGYASPSDAELGRLAETSVFLQLLLVPGYEDDDIERLMDAVEQVYRQQVRQHEREGVPSPDETHS